MEDILKDLIISIINEATGMFDGFLVDLTEVAFYVENSILRTVINLLAINGVLLKYAIAMMILKFIMKIFSIYIGWTAGDSDTNPLQLVINFIKAIAIAMAFNDIYKFMVDLGTEIIQELLNALSLSPHIDLLTAIVYAINFTDKGVFFVLGVLVFVIVAFLIYFQFIKRGLETYVLRMGVPIACIGLIDSDGGAYAPYFKLFIQNILTAIVQLTMFKVSFVIFSSGSLVFGLAAIFMTLGTPRFLQQYMLQIFSMPSASSVYHGGRMIRSGYAKVSRMIKKS